MISRRKFMTSMPLLGLSGFGMGEAFALQAGQPSRTAVSTAMQRAAHQLLENPLVFDDPLALRMLGVQRARWLAHNLHRFETPSSRAMRAFLVTRSRYAEDELSKLYAQGVRQHVILGAGLDTFAYRNPHGPALRVFEVDHPDTQAWKRAHLDEQHVMPPRSLTFVPVDFEKRSLADGLKRAGFAGGVPTCISWLGVTMYLTRDAVLQTLRFVAQTCARGSEIVFDFAMPDELLGEAERASRARRAARVAAIGEPWISRFAPEDLAGEMLALGFSGAQHFGAEAANARYFSGRDDGFRWRGSARIMTARV